MSHVIISKDSLNIIHWPKVPLSQSRCISMHIVSILLWDPSYQIFTRVSALNFGTCLRNNFPEICHPRKGEE